MISILPYIPNLYSSTWFWWTMLGLLGVLVLNMALGMNVGGMFRSVFGSSERVYTFHSIGILGDVSQLLYRVGLLSLTVLWVVSSGIDASAWHYLMVLAVVSGVYTVQYVVMRLIGAVYIPVKLMDNLLEQYKTIRMLICCLLFPILLVCANSTNNILPLILLGILLLVYLICIILKGIQNLYSNALSILYILLYTLSLEVVPLAAVCYLTRLLIRL